MSCLRFINIGYVTAVLGSLLLVVGGGRAQTAVGVGAGSYASSIPSALQYVGGYYSMTAQQVVNYYTNLHVLSSLTNRPMPSNKWWTDILVADRSYQPAANQPRVIVQDPYGGQLWSYPVMLAPNSAGFNLYYPNLWTPSGANPAQPQGSFQTGPALPITGYVAPSVGPNDVLIADFDESNYPAGWVTTGTAFGTGPIQGGTWPGEAPAVTGFIGSSCVNTYRGANTPQGTLTSPTFTITKHYIEVLAGGGADTNNDAVKLLIGTNVVYAAAGNQSGTLYWNTWDVSAYLGATNAQIEVVDSTSASWGFVLCSWIVESDNGTNPGARYTSSFSPVNSQVTDWSDWGFRFGLPDALGNRMDITLARGVPFVWTTYTGSMQPQIGYGGATLYDTNGNVIATGSGSFTNSVFAFDYQGRSFGVFAPDSTVFQVNGSVLQTALNGTNNYLVYGLLPAHTNLAEFAQYAYAEVTNTTYGWSYQPTNGYVATTWNLATTSLKGNETNTLEGWLPHHYRTTSNNLVFKPYTYLTPRGIMKVAAGNQFQVDFNFRGIAPVLPAPHLNNVTNDYVASRMTNFMLAFAANYPANQGNTYDAGKNFGLTAQYMSFAHQMGMTNQEQQLASGLRTLLENWYTYTPGEGNSFFAQYSNWRALIGFPPGYGSEGFNDNHFHYGYFMDATALLGMEDTNFIAQYGPMAKLVAKEYANWDRSDTNFPFLRTFDIWEGHSWAGGFSSGGGENQESSSEAMNSWVGLFLMGNVTGDSAMTAAGAMGYAIESTAGNEYWQDMYHANLPASYGKGGVGILGAGGDAYGTYFSGDPAWIYGIQWVPANHWNNYLCRDKVFANWQLTNMWNERVIASSNGINGFTLADANNTISQGEYLGNYIWGFETLFNADEVAAEFDAAYATNAPIATGANYSGETYYLTHSLRGLGDQDLNYYTSIPTSQVYYNSRSGQRTYVIYNPAATNQVATVFNQGTAVDSVTVPAGALVATGPITTNRPVVSLQTGAQVAWPTTSGDNYQLQWLAGATWQNYGGLTVGTGSSNSVFDASYPTGRSQYRVLDIVSSGGNSLVVNGGFESGAGTNATGWSVGGSQPAFRENAAAHSGSYSFEMYTTNTASTPNTSSMAEDIASAGGGAVVPGTAYTFSFWAMRAGNGPSYVQNYGVSWRDTNDAQISFSGWNGFSAGNGVWAQIQATNLVAPAGAVNAVVQLYGATGAVAGGYGGSYIDDLSFGPSTGLVQTNVVSPTVVPGAQVSWTTEAGYNYQVQKTGSLNPATGWTNPVTLFGTGGVEMWFDATGTNGKLFYRVVKTQ